MDRRKIRWIIVLMSLALAGIIALQIKWIRDDFQLKEQQFDQAVNHALSSVVDRIETKEAAKILQNRLFSINPDSISEMMLSDTMNADVYQVRDTIIETASEPTSNSGPWPETAEKQGRNITLPQQDRQRSFLRVQRRNIVQTDSISKRTIESSQITRIYGDSAEVVIRQNEERIKSRLSKLNEVMKKMAIEFVGSDKDVLDRINKVDLDSIIKNELKNNSIELPFQYGVVSSMNGSILYSNTVKSDSSLLTSPYKIILFPHDVVARPDYLFVRFKDTLRYFLDSMWFMLLSSAVLTFVLIFGFAYTIQVILRQKKLSDIKTDFINNMTHEFKTPIATISLAVDSLRNPKAIADPSKFEYFTRIIREENRRMNNQVERVLQMAQIDKQELELRKETVDLHQLIDHAIEQLRIQVESRNGTLTKDLLANNAMVFGDPVHLSNIIFNLLDNANKYSVDRPVIHIETVADSTGISVRVKDQGIGMTRETQKRIFEKFYRVPTGNIHNIKGFGLGLSYVDIILKKHNGWIQVQSEPGKGSTFEFHVPLSTSL